MPHAIPVVVVPMPDDSFCDKFGEDTKELREMLAPFFAGKTKSQVTTQMMNSHYARITVTVYQYLLSFEDLKDHLKAHGILHTYYDSRVLHRADPHEVIIVIYLPFKSYMLPCDSDESFQEATRLIKAKVDDYERMKNWFIKDRINKAQ